MVRTLEHDIKPVVPDLFSFYYALVHFRKSHAPVPLIQSLDDTILVASLVMQNNYNNACYATYDIYMF